MIHIVFIRVKSFSETSHSVDVDNTNKPGRENRDEDRDVSVDTGSPSLSGSLAGPGRSVYFGFSFVFFFA